MDRQQLKKYLSDPCVIVMIGASGSGKSTLAHSLSEGPFEVVSSDHYRGVLTGDESEQRISGVVFQMIYNLIKIRSEYRQRTILDATNLKRRDRKAYYGPVVKGLPAYAILVKTPEKVCLERQKFRDRQVPDWVVEKHSAAYDKARQQAVDVVEKWAGVFEVDTLTGEVSILR